MSDGLLDKLKIIPFKDSESVQTGLPAGPPFIAQFNPESFSVQNDIVLSDEQVAQGANGGEAGFVAVSPREYSFEFLLDGTGAAGPSIDVFLQLKNFQVTTGFFGDSHRSRFLVLHWGTFIATCVLKSYTVNYKLFRPNGTPLRAVISATFSEHIANDLQQLISNLMSPDVTHIHEVIDGEQLANISHQVYNSPDYYLQVAEHNQLDNVRCVRAGQSLSLPPLKGSS